MKSEFGTWTHLKKKKIKSVTFIVIIFLKVHLKLITSFNISNLQLLFLLVLQFVAFVFIEVSGLVHEPSGNQKPIILKTCGCSIVSYSYYNSKGPWIMIQMTGMWNDCTHLINYKFCSRNRIAQTTKVNWFYWNIYSPKIWWVCREISVWL